MAGTIKAPKGTWDLLPKASSAWQQVEEILRDEARITGFSEIRTPVFEDTALFSRSVGETTDVVQKEMYTFVDKGGRSITLRPEGTAGAVRAMLEHGLYNDGYPIKVYYFTSCYRYENTQKGRLREFHQFGAEVFGSASPVADAELMTMVNSFFERIGLRNIRLEINSIGCPACRAKYHQALKAYFQEHLDALCPTCKDRLERNPMRILDCKNHACKEIAAGAPMMKDYLCDDCRDHFDGVKRCLEQSGVAYTVNPMIVRGLDYYIRTVFEFISEDLGAQSTVCGGGRYDGLVEELGGQHTPALGYAMGLERLMMILEAQNIPMGEEDPCMVYLASRGKEGSETAFALTIALRECGLYAQCDLCDRSVKAQMKYANKINAQYTVVIGEEEIATQKAKLKEMATGQEVVVSLHPDAFVKALVEKEAMAEAGMLFETQGEE